MAPRHLYEIIYSCCGRRSSWKTPPIYYARIFQDKILDSHARNEKSQNTAFFLSVSVKN